MTKKQNEMLENYLLLSYLEKDLDNLLEKESNVIQKRISSKQLDLIHHYKAQIILYFKKIGKLSILIDNLDEKQKELLH